MRVTERIILLATAYIAATVYVGLELPYFREIGIALAALCLATTAYIFKHLPSLLRQLFYPTVDVTQPKSVAPEIDKVKLLHQRLRRDYVRTYGPRWESSKPFIAQEFKSHLMQDLRAEFEQQPQFTFEPKPRLMRDQLQEAPFAHFE